MELTLCVLVAIAVLLYMIIRGIDKLFTAKEAENQAGKAQRIGFDVRAQILSNAEVLWLMARDHYLEVTGKEVDDDLISPSMALIIMGSGTCFSAEVIFTQMEGAHLHTCSFLATHDMDSAQKAKGVMLDVTMELLKRGVQKKFQFEKLDHLWAEWVHDAEGNDVGWMEKPSGRCHSGRCDQRVWK
ncbi:hypothetical protein LTR15_000212 [Elasticomyces elasticus]|nr:hypothetical protein LTR15_000212 [Elasticomyces elasticus]